MLSANPRGPDGVLRAAEVGIEREAAIRLHENPRTPSRSNEFGRLRGAIAALNPENQESHGTAGRNAQRGIKAEVG
jgi:hypothetical protein